MSILILYSTKNSKIIAVVTHVCLKNFIKTFKIHLKGTNDVKNNCGLLEWHRRKIVFFNNKNNKGKRKEIKKTKITALTLTNRHNTHRLRDVILEVNLSKSGSQ